MNPLTQPKNATILLVLIGLTLGFGLSPRAEAVCQDGCLTNSNTALGESALVNNTTGLDNTALGYNALLSNTTGNGNTASGTNALVDNTTGLSNTANGSGALYSNTIGNKNTASGGGALLLNTAGSENTATGIYALYSNTIGNDNTATGIQALYSNTTASNNTATGFDALYFNTTGGNNTAMGVSALTNNTNGGANTATGYNALALNTAGASNSALGAASLFSNNTGNNNTAVGINALENNSSGSSNIALGDSAGINLTTGKNNIDIGNAGIAGESSKIRIGTSGTQKSTYIAGIRGVTVPSGVGVVVGTDGKLGTVVSSAQYKEKVQPMDKASEVILDLKPVTFRYKQELDPDSIPQFGLVAEQVEKVDPDLVARDEQGKPFTVRYEAVNAMLLNEFLKEHRDVQDLKNTVTKQAVTIAQQQKNIEALTAALKAQAAPIQKVSDQIGAHAAVPRVVAND